MPPKSLQNPVTGAFSRNILGLFFDTRYPFPALFPAKTAKIKPTPVSTQMPLWSNESNNHVWYDQGPHRRDLPVLSCCSCPTSKQAPIRRMCDSLYCLTRVIMPPMLSWTFIRLRASGKCGELGVGTSHLSIYEYTYVESLSCSMFNFDLSDSRTCFLIS